MQKLEILYQNVRGLRTRVQQFYTNTLLNRYDIIAVTETWLHQGICNGELFEQNYVVFRKDRNETDSGATRGGGLILAVDKKVLAERYSAIELQDVCVEQIWIRVQVRKNSWLYIGLFYFPPGTDRGNMHKSMIKSLLMASAMRTFYSWEILICHYSIFKI